MIGCTLLSFSELAFADDASDCSDQNNLKEPLISSSGELRPRNQGSSGWCHAYVAADLLSHHLGKKVSAVDLANASSQKTVTGFFGRLLGEKESEIRGGYADLTLKIGLENGLCLEKDAPSNDHLYEEKLEDYDYTQSLSEVEKIYQLYQESLNQTGLKKYFTSPREKKKKQAREVLHQNLVCNSELLEISKNLFPGLAPQDLISILVQSTSIYKFINKLYQNSCKPRFKPERPVKVHTQNSHLFGAIGGKGSELLKTIDEQLDNGNIVAFSHSHKILYEPKTVTRFSAPDHDALIVARRFNPSKKRCEYLLRNSWGRGCSYHHDYECESGHIWLPKDAIEVSARGVSYIE